MYRTAAIAVALAVLAVAGARGAQATPTAKTHRRSSVAAARAVRLVASSRGVHERATARTRLRTGSRPRVSVAGRRTPEEVGRSAGLEIRRQLAEGRVTYHRAAYVERGRAVRQAEIERAALRRERAHAAYAADEMEWRRAGEPARTSDDERASDFTGTREATLASEPAQPNPPPDIEDDRATEPEAAQAAGNERQPEADGADAVESQESSASQRNEPTDATKAANSDEDSEEASLDVPRGGMPAPLRGSLASLERQNARLDAEGLERIENEADLRERIEHGLLVPLPVSNALTVNADLPELHRYCRPWTARFLTDLARAHEAVFQRPLEVSSAVRPADYQRRLMETNGNAAPAEGNIVSPHETGATIDIAKDGLSRDEIAWMRRRLAALQAEGKIDVEEEFQQACFHITVYKGYAPQRKTSRATQGKTSPAKTQRITPDSLGAMADQGA